MSNHVIVIGAGASGLMAAIYAATEGATVTVLEQNERFGKKLLCTGNGKCNLSNTNQEDSCYRGTNPIFALHALHHFSVQDTIQFFQEIGIYVRNKNGYLYPHSEQASSVLELLEMKARSLKVKLKSNEKVLHIKNEKNIFSLTTQTWTYTCDSVIISTGSKASSVEGSCDSGYTLAEELGHCIIKPLPALVPLKGVGTFFGKWAGVRAEADATIMVNHRPIISEVGEIQFTDYGLSGIPIFQLSRYVARLIDEGVSVWISLDFMPSFTIEALTSLLQMRAQQCPYKTIPELMIGILPKKLIPILIENQDTLEQLARRLKDFSVPISRTLSFSHAQVASGGISTLELDVDTMESKLCPNLYFAGEVMDIDGTCGGYNLQWAWTSGALAGMAAARKGKL